MLKLTKYLKPFTVMILISIVMLFVQAMSDLALPDYMSDIVNIGIQQSGIESPMPKAIRKSQMDKLTLFMSPEEQQSIMSIYKLYDEIKDKEPIYVMNEDVETDELDLIMAKALLAVSNIEKLKNGEDSSQMMLDGMQIPENVDIYDMLKNMPSQQREKITGEINNKLDALGEKMILQMATNVVKEEYEIIGIDTNELQNDYIINTGIKMLLIALLSGAATVIVGLLAAKIAAGFARDIRKKVFEKVERFSGFEFDQFSTASLITRTTNDITQIQMFIILMVRIMFYAPIMGFGGIIRAINNSSSMSWIIALAVIVLLGLILVIFSIAMPKFKAIQKLIDKLNLVTRENLSGMMVIRAFNTQDFEEERFDKANKDLTRTSLFVNRVMAFLFPAMMFIMNGITILIVWVGSHQIAESTMQVGDMMAFMQYAMQIIFAFLMMSMMFIMVPRASVSGQRVSEVLNKELSILDPEQPKNLSEIVKGVVEFQDVSFRYPGAEEDMLKNISFKAMPGETTAIIGATGSGKTTLVNLIPRFYDVTKGKVLIDNVDVREVKQHDLREHIGYVPQKSYLFSGTIESNLKYADENASEETINKAVEIAQAKEIINEKEEGFNSSIAQGGTNVSGGQKQRLSIARALVKRPSIYIFDDSFSALDFKTDANLRKALKKQTGSSTVILITQRISTAMDAEKIIVLDEGRIVGMGTHRELMKNCETYQEIALSQLSKEELA